VSLVAASLALAAPQLSRNVGQVKIYLFEL
jgi:hypothetical protein